jgi:hypothetical protein
LFRWAKKAKLVKVDPTVDVDAPKQKKTDGFAAFTEDDVAVYRQRWALGTRERVWLEVGLNTGMRRGDAVIVGKQHVRDGVITLKTEKTNTEVTIPIQPELAEPWRQARVATLLSLLVPMASASPKKASAMNSAKPAARPASAIDHFMVCASSRPCALPMRAPPCRR